MADQLSPEQLAQLTGLGPCFIHYHTDTGATISSVGTALQKGNGLGGLLAAVSGVDYGMPLSIHTDVFTSSSTWTKPATGTIAIIDCWGGGGSGDGAAGGGGAGNATHGGGGGGFNRVMIPLADLPASVTVTIGAGGAQIVYGGMYHHNGNQGGRTSFGTYVWANGGFGGTYNVPGSGGNLANINQLASALDSGFSGAASGSGNGGGQLASSTFWGGEGGDGFYENLGSPARTVYGGLGGTYGATAPYIGGTGQVPGGGGGAAGGILPGAFGGAGGAGLCVVRVI